MSVDAFEKRKFSATTLKLISQANAIIRSQGLTLTLRQSRLGAVSRNWALVETFIGGVT